MISARQIATLLLPVLSTSVALGGTAGDSLERFQNSKWGYKYRSVTNCEAATVERGQSGEVPVVPHEVFPKTTLVQEGGRFACQIEKYGHKLIGFADTGTKTASLVRLASGGYIVIRVDPVSGVVERLIDPETDKTLDGPAHRLVGVLLAMVGQGDPSDIDIGIERSRDGFDASIGPTADEMRTALYAALREHRPECRPYYEDSVYALNFKRISRDTVEGGLQLEEFTKKGCISSGDDLFHCRFEAKVFIPKFYSEDAKARARLFAGVNDLQEAQLKRTPRQRFAGEFRQAERRWVVERQPELMGRLGGDYRPRLREVEPPGYSAPTPSPEECWAVGKWGGMIGCQ